jgi:hypothetical protein
MMFIELIHDENGMYVAGMQPEYDLFSHVGKISFIFFLRGFEHVERRRKKNFSGRKNCACVVQIDLRKIFDDLKAMFSFRLFRWGPKVCAF